jgi:cystathionine gamma-lyase
MHRDTAILHAGYRSPAEPGPFRAGPQFSSTYASPGDPSTHPLTYGRFHNPTWTAWETALGELEGGEVVAFASGMAAASAVLGVTLKPGDIAVLPADCYYTIRLLASNWLSTIGVQVRLLPTRGNGQEAALDGARLLWMETPTNPQLDICDIGYLARRAAAQGIATVVDNTTATAYLQRPLALGATYVVSSDTKALTGHSDLLLGHVATGDPELGAALRTWRTQHGAIPGPMEVWLAHRSLATLPLRLGRQCSTAMRLATHLAGHRAVASVSYPGLRTHDGFEIAARQMDAFGPVVSFDLETRGRAEQFLRALRLVREATSFGGVHSTAERRARWGGDAVSEGFIRFSVGCEAAEDLIEDVDHALTS